ncbi:unnamed protein product [Brassica oleracea var. botrytis]
MLNLASQSKILVNEKPVSSFLAESCEMHQVLMMDATDRTNLGFEFFLALTYSFELLHGYLRTVW